MFAQRFGIEVGKVYQSRRGSHSPEREVLWISQDGTKVQYDGPAVKQGQRYPTVSAEAFAKWAGLSEGSGQ